MEKELECKTADRLLKRGGELTELRRIGSIANAAGIPLIPHRANVYSSQYGLARPDTPYLEYMLGSGTEPQPVPLPSMYSR
jgi:hypothetical protein